MRAQISTARLNKDSISDSGSMLGPSLGAQSGSGFQEAMEQLARMAKFHTEATDRLAALQQESKGTIWERDGLEISLVRLDTRWQILETDRTKVGHYLDLAWNRMRPWIICALAFYYLGWMLLHFRRRRLAPGSR